MTDMLDLTQEAMPIGGVRPSAGVSAPADLVVRNAKIYTGDKMRPAASAAAIRDGRFEVVGGDADVAPLIGQATRVIDAVGRRVVPGLNDSHQHVIRAGMHFLLELRWDGITSLGIALRMLGEQAQRTPPGQWVRVIGGWSMEQFAEKRLPTIAELNAAAPETPVLVTHCYQSGLLNRAGLEAIGYTRDTPDPPGGEIVKDHAGNPTGVLLAAPGAVLLYNTIAKLPVMNPDDQLASTRHLMRELNRFGLTSAIDAAGGAQRFPDDYATVTRLSAAGESTLRVAYHLLPQVPGQELQDIRRWVSMIKPGDGDEWLRCNGAGENITWSAADFENFAEPRPELIPSAAADLEACVRVLLENSWSFRQHATYDETIRLHLGVYEKIARAGEWPDGVRWLVDHAETVSPASLDRITALGGGIGVQHRLRYQGEVFTRRYGPDKAAVSPPIRAMLSAGLLVGAGTDAPRVSSYNPWLSLSWLVTGQTVGGFQLYPPGNRVDRETALGMYTTAGAAISGESDVKGTISAGKYADLAILSADYFAIEDEDIGRIESLLTIVGGKIAYAAADYEGLARPLPPIPLDWSPVLHYGGYHQCPSGVRQAQAIAQAAAESRDHLSWRQARGEVPPSYRAADDPLRGCW